MRQIFIICCLTLPASAETIVGKVVGVTDGDTLTLRTEAETLRVRLEAIDTPERGQPYGTKAKQASHPSIPTEEAIAVPLSGQVADLYAPGAAEKAVKETAHGKNSAFRANSF